MSTDPASARIETGTVEVAGIETFYRRIPGDGPPAVFVHGVPTHSEDWVEVMAAMRGPAIAMDLPGFGRSERPSPARFDYGFETYGSFLWDFLEAMDIGEYSLCVHDWGGIGLLAAQRDPSRVRRLVVMDCVPFLPGYSWHRTAKVWRTRGLGELMNKLFTRRVAERALRESRGDFSPHSAEFVDMIFDHLDPGTFDAILRLYRSADPEKLERSGGNLGAIDCPALVIWAGKDRYIGTKFGRGYAGALGNAELVVLPEAGHWLWRDDPSVIPRIAGFLESP